MPIDNKTAEQYYDPSNEPNYGSYQFVAIEELINNFMLTHSGNDTVLGVIDRFKVVGVMKRCIRELTFNALNRPKIVELDLMDNFDVILPQNYVNYIRISWINRETGKIMPMSVNKDFPLGIAYLQDNDGKILYDNNGEVLIGSTILEETNNLLTAETTTLTDIASFEIDKPIWNLDTTVNHNGTFTINEQRIHFSTATENRTILLEYISDGLDVLEADMKIHKFAEQALYAYVNAELSDNSIRVPEYEKRRINKKKDTLIHNLKVKMLNIKPQEFLQQFKASRQWLK